MAHLVHTFLGSYLFPLEKRESHFFNVSICFCSAEILKRTQEKLSQSL